MGSGSVKASTCIVTTALATTIILFWGILTLPTIFFAVPAAHIPASTRNHTEIDGDGRCTAQVYTGKVCRSSLLGYQSCVSSPAGILNRNKEVHILTGDSQEELEISASMLQSGFKLLGASEACMSAAIPLLCLNTFGLCDDNGREYLPSRSQCINVSTGICAVEFQTAVVTLEADQLPQCDTLPEDSPDCIVVIELQSNASSLECSQDFYYDEQSRSCLPECGQWMLYSSAALNATSAIIIILFSFTIIATVVLLVITYLKPKRMLTFPTVLTLYNAFSISVLGIVFLIGYFDRPSLFCSSQNMLENINNPTPFCTLTGIIAIYVPLQVACWWTVHVVSISWGVLFPFHFKRTVDGGKMKYVHILIVPICILAPCASFISILINGGYKDIFFLMPLCVPHEGAYGAAFHATVTLLLCITLAVGVCLLAAVLASIFKAHSRSSSNVGRTAETKVLLLLCYYIIISLVYLIATCLLYWQLDIYIEMLFAYLSCEAKGATPNEEPCRKNALQSNPFIALYTVDFALLALFPVVSVTYATNLREMKNAWRILRTKFDNVVGKKSSVNFNTENSTIRIKL